MTVKGDYDKLKALIARVGEAASGKLYERAKLAASEQAIQLVQEGFREQRDPDMQPWQKLRRARKHGAIGSAKVLIDRGRLRASFTRQITRDGFRIGSAVNYATFHQKGTRRMVRRSMVPNGPLSAYWQARMSRAIQRVPRLHFLNAR
jgi:phage gpG-like protein